MLYMQQKGVLACGTMSESSEEMPSEENERAGK